MKDLAVPSTVIQEALAENGWAVEEIVSPDEWWCRERWHLLSVWSPQHCEAYLTFLTDPMDEHPGKDHLNYREVWAVAASSQIPSSRSGAESGQFVVSFGNAWRNRVPELVKYLHGLREASAI